MNTGVKRRNKKATTYALLPAVVLGQGGGGGGPGEAMRVRTQHRVLSRPIPTLGRGLGVEGSSQPE